MTPDFFLNQQWDTAGRRAARVQNALEADALRTGKLPGNSADVKVDRHRRLQVLPTVAAVACFALLIVLGRNCFSAMSYKSHYEAGLAALSAGNENRAQVEFSLAIGFKPKSADALYYLGQAEVARGSHGNALKSFSQALDLQPNSAKFHLGRAALYMKTQSWQKAIADCDAAVKVEPTCADAYSVSAAAHSHLGQYAEAVDATGKYLVQPGANDARRAEVLAQRGFAHDQLKDFDAAIADYTEALKCDPGSASLYAGRAVVYMHAEQWQSAIADCNDSSQLRPNNPVVFKVRGICNGKLRQLQDSLADLDTLVMLNESVDTHRIRGRQRLAAGDLLGTLADFDYVLTAEPEDGHTSRQYIRAKSALEARAPRTAAVADAEPRAKMPNQNDLNKSNGELLRRGRSLFLNGDFEPAIAYFVTALRRSPMDLTARNYLADACVQTGREPSAIRQYSVVLALNPADDSARMKLIRVLMNEHRADDAARMAAAGAQQTPELYQKYNALFQKSVAMKSAKSVAM